MKLALLADIHSNYVALEACLKYIDLYNFDGICFLGDYISDCPYPQKTIRLLRKVMKRYKTWFIRGNREDYLINHHYSNDDGWRYSSISGSFLYTYENITEDDLSFFERLPIARSITLDGYPPFTICHGSPEKSREPLYPNTEIADKYLQSIDNDYLFCAHTHAPFKYQAYGKVLVNCASVGEPVNRQTCAQFISLEYIKGKWNDCLISVEYDVAKVINDFNESGLYDKAFFGARSIAKLLQTGEDVGVECIRRVTQMAQKANMNIHDLPEKYWEQAAKEIGII